MLLMCDVGRRIPRIGRAGCVLSIDESGLPLSCWRAGSDACGRKATETPAAPFV